MHNFIFLTIVTDKRKVKEKKRDPDICFYFLGLFYILVAEGILKPMSVPTVRTSSIIRTRLIVQTNETVPIYTLGPFCHASLWLLVAFVLSLGYNVFKEPRRLCCQSHHQFLQTKHP